MTTTERIYRDIPLLHQACTVCDEVVPSMSARRLRTTPPIRLHGPRGNRCAGSHEVGKPWIEATHLPQWGELSDVDKGSALMFVWKCWWERSYRYAHDNYPATYIEHPMLLDLPVTERCRHATAVALDGLDRYAFRSSYHATLHRLGEDEFKRLYDLALDAERAAHAGGAR